MSSKLRFTVMNPVEPDITESSRVTLVNGDQLISGLNHSTKNNKGGIPYAQGVGKIIDII